MKDQGDQYDKIAQDFARVRQEKFSEKKYIDLLVSKIPPKGHILDVGCGCGDPIAAYLLHLGFNLTGIDVSRKLLTLAKAKCAHMQFIYGDMRTVCINAVYDAVIAYDSFFHLPIEDQEGMIARFAGWLKKSGWLLFTTGPEESEGIHSTMFKESFSYYSLSPAKYQALLETYGFKVIEQISDMPNHLIWIAEKIK